MKKLWIIPLLFSINVHASLLDFQQLEHIDNLNTVHGLQYLEDGFQIEDQSGSFGLWSFGTLHPEYTGSTALFNDGLGQPTQLSKLGGGAFDIFSIDLGGELVNGSTHNVTFIRDGGHSQTFILDGNSFTVQTFLFDSGFLGSSNITWGGNAGAQFDNIQIDVSNVPVPAAVWLFGSGLIGLIGVKRKLSKEVSVSA